MDSFAPKDLARNVINTEATAVASLVPPVDMYSGEFHLQGGLSFNDLLQVRVI
jgi:hypothetical protein